MQQLAQAAYQPYVARIGRRPAPMTTDYATITIARSAWVAEQGGYLVGLLVLEPAEDHLLVDNVAVAPDARGLGWAAGYCDWPKSKPTPGGCPRCGCIPTRP